MHSLSHSQTCMLDSVTFNCTFFILQQFYYMNFQASSSLKRKARQRDARKKSKIKKQYLQEDNNYIHQIVEVFKSFNVNRSRMLSSSNLIIEYTSSNLAFSQQINANVVPLKSSINQRDLSVFCLGSHVAEPLQKVPWAIREEIFIFEVLPENKWYFSYLAFTMVLQISPFS